MEKKSYGDFELDRRKEEGRHRAEPYLNSTLCVDIFDEMTVGLVVNRMGFWAKKPSLYIRKFFWAFYLKPTFSWVGLLKFKLVVLKKYLQIMDK